MTAERIKRLFLGKKLDIEDSNIMHKIALAAFFAWIGLGSDGLSSSCYGPSEVMQTLGAHTALSLIVAFASLFTILIISSSYSQIIELFPHGGGGYLVATKLLSPKMGMISGSALIIDYILTITVSVASGSDALFSLIGPEWLYLKTPFSVFILIILIALNMRGVKESVMALMPIFLVFVGTHIFAILYAIITHSFEIGAVAARTQTELSHTVSELGVFGAFFLMVRAYSMGAGTYTGIEAVSNGIPILKEPKVHTAKKTMTYMAISLAITVFGLLLAYLLYQVNIEPGKTINAILFQKMTINWPPMLGSAFVVVTLLSEGFILYVAAQTGFLDGPRILANMALDKWAPTKFSNLNDRLVTQNGVLLMGIASLILIVLSNGQVSFLVVLYSINVFITFVLSQLGMVRHWLQVRRDGGKWLGKFLINGAGLFLCSFILIFVVIVKFFEGGWITVFITGALVLLLSRIKKHYTKTEQQIKALDLLTDETLLDGVKPNNEEKALFNMKGKKTAVLFVSNFSGIGIHSVWSILKLFGDTIGKFVFISVRQIDAGIFKDADELPKLNAQSKENIQKYIDYVNKLGFEADSFTSVGPNFTEEISKLVDTVKEKYPDTIYFGGQLVPEKESFMSKYLHNYNLFNVQRELYLKGIQFVILPLKLGS
jgi:amino acid transporter